MFENCISINFALVCIIPLERRLDLTLLLPNFFFRFSFQPALGRKKKGFLFTIGRLMRRAPRPELSELKYMRAFEGGEKRR